jgi:uncharacterized damage-inducible protein DinB
MTDPRYPLGPFQFQGPADPDRRRASIDRMAALPGRLRAAVEGLDEAGLALRYREGGWTIRQVVHHVPDSHMNGLIRLRLALTEERPTIKPYDEAAWAELPDARTAPIEASLRLLEGLHERWVRLLRALDEADFARTFIHPQQQAERDLDWLLALYAWHGDHHVAQVEQARALRIRG